MVTWVCKGQSKFWTHFLAFFMGFWNGTKILIFHFLKLKFGMQPWNPWQNERQTRKLRISQLLFTKLKKSKQTFKMFITLVLTLLPETLIMQNVHLCMINNISYKQINLSSACWEIAKSIFKSGFLSFFNNELRKLS